MTMPRVASQQTAFAIADGPDLVATLPASLYEYFVVGMNINGPAKLTVQCFIGNRYGKQFETTLRSDSNSWFATEPIRVPPGEPVTVVWLNGASGSAYVNFTLKG